MAKDWWGIEPEKRQEKAKKEAEKHFKEASEKYNDSAFTPDSKMPLDLKIVNTFESVYETLCYNIAAEGLVRMPVDAIRRKLSKYMSKNFVDKFTKLAQDYSDGKIDAEKFLNETQTLGNKAQKYFYDSGQGGFVNESLKKTKKTDKEALSNWAKNAAKESGDSKVGTISKAVEAFDSTTNNHVKNVGLMLDKYINDPAISKWLASEGYDVDKLKKAIKLVGESHDDGKLLVLLDDIESQRTFPRGKNPISPHEEKGRDFLKKVLTPEEDVIPGAKNGETFSEIANKHGQNKAETPLEQLVAMVDQMEAALSPRSYKAGLRVDSPNNFAVGIIKGTDRRTHYNFPDEVRSSLLDKYEDFYKSALETRTGRKLANWYDVVKAQNEVINENPIAINHQNIRKDFLKKQETVLKPSTRVLAEEAKKDKEKPGVSSIRTEAYNKYKAAFPSASGKKTRKVAGFIADTVGLDPMSIMVKTIREGGPDRLKKRLGQFNERFQASDQEDIKKEAIQYLTDNWDKLSDADRSYFKYRIEKDNKDFINGR